MTRPSELGNERDPIIGTQDGTLEFKIPKRPIRSGSPDPGVQPSGVERTSSCLGSRRSATWPASATSRLRRDGRFPREATCNRSSGPGDSRSESFATDRDARVRGVRLGVGAEQRGVPARHERHELGRHPAAGLTYTNLFILYARDESRGADGEVLATGGAPSSWT